MSIRERITQRLIEETSTTTGGPVYLLYKSADLDSKEFAKKAKAKNAKIDFGNWKEVKRGRYENSSGETITFYSITTYKKSGRLRVPSGTKYKVYVQFGVKSPNGSSFVATIDFGSATGEFTTSNEKIEKSKAKVIEWAKSAMGINLGQYDFAY